MESNQANQANNAVLTRRLQLVEKGVAGTPIGSSSGISRLTPQAPPSVTLNQTAIATPLESSKRMRVGESVTPVLASDVRLSQSQQGDTDLLAASERGNNDALTDENRQVTCDETEQSTASLTTLPVSEPEPTHITPFPKDDHDDDGDPDGLSSQPRAQDQRSLQVSGHKSEQSAMPKGGKGNSPTNEMMSAYEFGAVEVLNRPGNDNIPTKLPTTSFAPPNSAQKSFDNGGGSIGGNGGQGGDGGNGDGGDSNKGSNDSSGSSRGNRKSGGDPDGSGGDSGGGSSEPPHKVWESIPGEDLMRRFLSLLEAQLVKER